MKVNRKRLEKLVGFFSEDELQELGILEQEKRLVTGWVKDTEERKLSKYCFENNTTKSEILREILEKELQTPDRIRRLAKKTEKYKRETDTKSITFLVSIKQKKQVQEFVKEQKESCNMTEAFLIQLLIAIWLQQEEEKI